jgi:hypothetical protein
MKKTFAILLPFVGIFSILGVQVVAIKTVAPLKDTVLTVYAAPVIEGVAADSSVYATPEELGQVRGEYRYVAKGGLEKAKAKGQKVVDELDVYLLRLSKEVEAKKKQVAVKESELKGLKSPSAAVAAKVVNPKPQPSQEPNDDY